MATDPAASGPCAPPVAIRAATTTPVPASTVPPARTRRRMRPAVASPASRLVAR